MCDWFECFIGRVDEERYGSWRSGMITEAQKPVLKTKARMYRVNPTLPAYIFNGEPKMHKYGITNNQPHCKYCSYYLSMQKIHNVPKSEWITVRLPKHVCFICQVNIFKEHFDIYHDRASEKPLRFTLFYR